ncbi:hypothetical protein HELRODRAFT_182592 [Helobdella robusta]|uniref:Neurotransmitter-gated ion-channel ligand-binding domain-containing protein n=1 Tax=Helobdella robusta TaxID=6412 RepID=T1FIF5_HELRO|nr:hypothetical protein HELRODRAFT_182592 [Helobdella robusta]ESN90883.1 hypothetical protein HELRODRAFT_182592 [Helobdella robusta]
MGIINTEESYFEAELRVLTCWEDKRLERLKLKDLIDMENFWVPELKIQNAVDKVERLSGKLKEDTQRKAFVIKEVTLWGRFIFSTESFYYPLDIQHVGVIRKVPGVAVALTGFECKGIPCYHINRLTKVLIINSVSMLHFVKNEYQCQSIDFSIFDLVDSATTSDIDYYRKNFSVLKITFYAERKLTIDTIKWLVLPGLLNLLAILNLFVDNVLLSDKILVLIFILMETAFFRRFIKLTVFSLSVAEMYWWTVNLIVICTLLWTVTELYFEISYVKYAFSFLYFGLLIILGGLFFYKAKLRKSSLAANSTVYKDALKDFQRDESTATSDTLSLQSDQNVKSRGQSFDLREDSKSLDY